MRKETFGELSAYVAGGDDGRGGGKGPVVVLMHGFGAPGHDLVDFAQVFRLPNQPRFVFPEAPLLVDGGPGRAWWMIDQELFERRARGERVDRTDEQPAALPSVRSQVAHLLAEVQTRLGVEPSRVVLGGFSQGSMAACDVALHGETKPAALLLLSSTLIAQSQWAPRMASLRGLKVMMSHGTFDPILPFDDAVRLAELLQEGGADLEFYQFGGGHEIPPPVLREMARIIGNLG
jgi:phospholipase/carboxylesterase